VALLTLDPDAQPSFAREAQPPRRIRRRPLHRPTRARSGRRRIDDAKTHLSRVEQIKRFKLLPVDWEPGGTELTPTMKLKRKPIAAKYAEEIEALYQA